MTTGAGSCGEKNNGKNNGGNVTMTERGWTYLDDGEVVYRASSLGSCTRSLVCSRVGESAFPANAGLRAAMDASSSLEDEAIKRFCNEMVGEVIWQQKEVELKVPLNDDEPEVSFAIVRGHLDGLYQLDDSIIEVKCLGSTNFEKYDSGGLDALGFLGQEYKVQGAVYGHATERKVRFVIGEKDKIGQTDGSLKWGIRRLIIEPPVDPSCLVPLDDIYDKIRTIEDFAARDELPDCDGDCTRSSPFSECHLFDDNITEAKVFESDMARYQEIKHIVGSADKGTGLLGEMEDIKERLKMELGVGKFYAGPFTTNIVHKKAAERIDTKRLRKEHPEIAEEYKTFGAPSIQLTITGGD